MPRRGENIYKRKDGRWEGRYRYTDLISGKAKYRSVYAKSYQEVKKKLLLLRSDFGQMHSSGKLTVRQLFSEWLNAIRNTVKASTYANYTMKMNKHILPELGSVCYEELTPGMVYRFIAHRLERGLSAKYVSDIVIVMKSMAKYMKRVHGYHNPIEFVNLPRQQKTEKKIFSDSQQKKLTDYLIEHLNPTTLGILLSIYTGLRIGEICGLKWIDIDFRQRTLSIHRTVQRIYTEHGTRLSVDAPKSNMSPDSAKLKTLQRF